MTGTTVIVWLVVGVAILPLLTTLWLLGAWFAHWRRHTTDDAPMKIRCYVCRQDLWVQPSDPYLGINDHLASKDHKSNAKEKA